MEKFKVNVNGFFVWLLRFLSGVSKNQMKYEFPDICVLRSNMIIFFTLLILSPVPTLFMSIVFKLIDADGKSGKIPSYILITILAFFIGTMPFGGLSEEGVSVTFLKLYLIFPSAGIGMLAVIVGIIVGFIILMKYLQSIYANKSKANKLKPPKKPNIIVTMYKSWKNKYCIPIEYVDSSIKTSKDPTDPAMGS
jgi:hypothetical protein